MVEEKLINKDEALLRIDPKILDTLLHPTLDPKAKKDVIAKGLPASPGAASGKVTFTADDAETLKSQNQKTILVRLETSPEDIHGMNAAEGILTCRGPITPPSPSARSSTRTSADDPRPAPRSWLPR